MKWIVCGVESVQRDDFGRAQERWTDLRGVPGFVCQVGGWAAGSGDACIVALWQSSDSYHRFMARAHDELADRTRQAGTYELRKVATGSVVFPMRGAAPGPAAALTSGAVLRVADCLVHAGRESHLVDAQARVWEPAMACADGMLGGVFGVLGDRRYVVCTGWRDEESHQRYADEEVSALLERADTNTDLEHVGLYGIHIEQGWTVL